MANYAAGNAAQSDDWKSDFFINLFLPNQDGGRKKVGSIGLKLSKPDQKNLIEFLTADEANVEKFLGKLQATVAAADGSSSSSYDLT